jgi:hypothetical protein
MKKILYIILLIPTILVSQIQQPDTIKLSDRELFSESGNLNNVGVLQSYIDFSKDVLSTSNISIGIIGKQVSTTINLGYNKTSSNEKWEHKYLASVNPIWKYYGIGYGISRKKEKRTTTLQSFYSTDFNFKTILQYRL